MRKYINPALPLITSIFILTACVGGGSNENSASNQSGTINAKHLGAPLVYSPQNNNGGVPVPGIIVIPNDKIQIQINKLSKTVFAGVPYQNTKFIIKNIGTEPITNITDFSVTVDQSETWVETYRTNCTSISPNGTCEITGTFTGRTTSAPTHVTVSLKQNDTAIYEYSQSIVAIPPGPQEDTQDKYLAIRFTHPTDSTQKVFAAAVYGGFMVEFDDKHIGKITPYNDNFKDVNPERKTFSHFGVQIAGPGAKPGSDVLYLPKGGAGVILLSMDQKIADGAAPNPDNASDPSINTKFQRIEFSNNGYKADINKNETFINLTNVDHVSLPLEMDWVDNSQRALRVAAKYDILTESIADKLEEMAAGLNAVNPNSWGLLVQRDKDNGNKIIRILAPAKKTGFKEDGFDTYIDDIWSFYKETNIDGTPMHYIYVDVSEVLPDRTKGQACKLRGYVHSDENSNEYFYFEPLPEFTATCIDKGWGLDQQNGPLPGSPHLRFNKFTTQDFISGASGTTTYGENGSYRSVVGRSIVSGQYIGLLPYCKNTNLYYSGDNGSGATDRLFTQQYSDLFFTAQYSTCLAHAADYGDKIINQYSLWASNYFDYYNYPYSDAVGRDATLVGDNAQYPVTITIGKMK
ncbi:MAG: hypothetical protein K0R14_1685 [Burkholderiales bacterium]|jgi:hypothetical protein|nr:hypothetical protein [Burkholderiales bacterium]